MLDTDMCITKNMKGTNVTTVHILHMQVQNLLGTVFSSYGKIINTV